MVRFLLTLAFAMTLTLPGQALPAQDQAPAAEQYEFVSGIIAELTDHRIVVNRAVLGKPAENRAFLITSDTKVEGKLRVNSRVTVGFKPAAEGDVAVRIIVRAATEKKFTR